MTENGLDPWDKPKDDDLLRDLDLAVCLTGPRKTNLKNGKPK